MMKLLIAEWIPHTTIWFLTLMSFSKVARVTDIELVGMGQT